MALRAPPLARREETVLRKAIGLDFGTTNSALALAKPDGTVQLARFNGEAAFRSILYFDEHDSARTRKLRVVAGPDAIQSYLNAKTPGRLIQSMKSYLASRLFNQTQIMGETYSLEELIGILLRYLRQSAEAEFGDLGSKLVVGRPAHFSGTQDEADDEFAVNRLRAAFGHAGFEHVHFLPEPVAAAYKYQQRLDHDELVLIADFGGGTSDFSLVQLQAQSPSAGKAQTSVIGTDGVGIAGDTFDSKLVRNLVAPMLGLGSKYRSQFGKVLPVPNWLYEHLERWHYLSFLKTRKNTDLLRRIRVQALAAENRRPNRPRRSRPRLSALSVHRAHVLSHDTQTEFRFDEAAVAIEKPISRPQFEGWIDPEVSQISRCVDRLLTTCSVAPQDVDAIFMTGGSSFVPAIRKLFAQKFGAETPVRAGEEFTSVAEGLAIHALELLD